MKYTPKAKHLYCPNPLCAAEWGSAEISLQQCDSCGYPRENDSEEKPQGVDDLQDWTGL